MTDQDALRLADRPDWWMGPDGQGQSMRTLRQALTVMAGREGRAFLFRPGGFGQTAIWLSSEEIMRFHALLSDEAERAA